MIQPFNRSPGIAKILLVAFALVNTFGAGNNSSLSADEPGKTKTQIQWASQQLNEVFFSEAATAGDLNRDGDLDVISGPFWFEGPKWEKKHLIYNPKPFDPHRYSDNFFTYIDDINNDGWNDVLVFGFPGKAAHWYENPQNRERPWAKHLALDAVDNESPCYADLTADGQREIVCSQNGVFGYAKFDKKNPTAVWKFQPITGKVTGGKFTHGLGVGDVNGDKIPDLLEKTGWWEQVIHADKKTGWKKHEFAFSGPGGSQMFATDVNGDGLPDVITALEAHGYGVAWYEQIRQAESKETTFRRHIIVGAARSQSPYGIVFSQPHALCLADIDGDGLQDIVTGKRHWAHGPHGDPEPNGDAVLYWFRCQRFKNEKGDLQARFVPQLISKTAGVGVDVQVHDINGDKLLDVVVGNKLGTFVHLQSRKKVSLSQWQKTEPMLREMAAKQDLKSYADNDGKTPADAAKSMTVPEGFRVDLVAGEPNLHQPVAFCFDEKGRIWVAEAYTYPIRAAKGKGKDRILVLEDTNSDGKFDRQTIFAEGLNLVSGLEVGFGGVFVGAAPYLMFIPDKNDDLIPDATPEILLDGWGYQDTHETLNSFTWGPDGWLYGCQGVFTHSKVGKPGDPEEKRTPLNACVWRYHPTQQNFEVFAWGTSNPWGLDFNDHGEAFVTACVIPHAFHIIPGGLYHRQAGSHFKKHAYGVITTIADHLHYAGNIADHAWWRGRNEAAQSVNNTSDAGGGHAHCGALVYRGDNWPDAYRNSLLMCNIHGNRVNNDFLRNEGATFIASHGNDVIYANDPWFRGISLKTGPDGAVYLIDWSDKNACHRSTPEIWDRTNGRLFRISYGKYQQRKFDCTTASDESLIKNLSHKNAWHVTQARKELQKRYVQLPIDNAKKTEVVNLLKTDLHSTQPTISRLNSLWALHAISGLNEQETLKRLHDSEPEIRGWAIRLSAESKNISPQVLAQFEQMAKNEKSPLIHRELASVLQKIPVENRWDLAENLLANHDSQYDKVIPFLIWYGIEPLVAQNTKRALKLAGNSQIILVQKYIYRRAASSTKTLPLLVNTLAETKNQLLTRQMIIELDIALKKMGKVQLPARWSDVTQKFSTNKDAQIRAAVQAISVKFGDRTIFPALRLILQSKKHPLPARKQAMNVLVAGKDQAVVPVLMTLLNQQSLRIEALKAMTSFNAKQIPEVILEQIKSWNSNEQSTAIATLCSRASFANELFDAIENKKIPRTFVTAVHISQIQGLNDANLLKKVESVWGSIRQTPAEKLQQIAALKKELTPKSLASADLAAGRVVYNKTCGQCHRLFGAGGKVGPDLTGSNRKKLDYLLENMIDPNSLVGKDYQAISIVTADGRVVTGLIQEENDSAIVLQTVQQLVTIPKSEIEDRSQSPKSIMPEGQLKTLQKNQIQDLIAYLQSNHQTPLPGQGLQYDVEKEIVPGALEAEKMKVIKVQSGKARAQGMGGFPKDRWSGNSQLWWTGGKPGSVLVLEFPVKTTGKYEVLAVFTKAVDYATIEVKLDQQLQASPFDLFNKDVVTTGIVSLGTMQLEAGSHQLEIKITGKNRKASPSYMIGLDYLYLEKPAITSPEK